MPSLTGTLPTLNAVSIQSIVLEDLGTSGAVPTEWSSFSQLRRLYVSRHLCPSFVTSIHSVSLTHDISIQDIEFCGLDWRPWNCCRSPFFGAIVRYDVVSTRVFLVLIALTRLLTLFYLQ